MKNKYEAGEKIPITREMFEFLCQLWAEENGMEIKSIKYG